jgi:phage repressor protein C with HTH and peptisase S24 domain
MLAIMTEPGDLIRAKREAIGLTQTQLADELGTKQQTIEKIENGITKKSSYFPAISARLGIPLTDLDPAYKAATEHPNSLIIPEAKLMAPGRDFPVYASAEGGPGEIIRSTDPIDFVPRPGPVLHVREAYGIIVVNDSMEPEFRPGDTLIVNPKAPIINGESYVFYTDHEGEARATVKHLRRTTQEAWQVSQWNPAKDFPLKRKDWCICHRVLGKYSRQ